MHLSSFQYLGQKLTSRNLNGLELTLTSYPSNQRQPWHEHENPNMFLLLDGQFCDKSKELGEKSLEPLNVVFHPAGARHAGEAGPKGRAGLNIEPTQRWLNEYGVEPAQTDSYRVLDCPASNLLALRLALELNQGEALAQDMILEIVLPILSIERREVRESPGWFKQIDSILRDSDLRDCNLKHVAHLVAVHPVYLARVFRERHSCSLGEYVIRKRLLRSSVSVINEGASLAEAACEGGFADQSYFTKLFRRETRHTPAALLQLRRALSVATKPPQYL